MLDLQNWPQEIKKQCLCWKVQFPCSCNFYVHSSNDAAPFSQSCSPLDLVFRELFPDLMADRKMLALMTLCFRCVYPHPDLHVRSHSGVWIDSATFQRRSSTWSPFRHKLVKQNLLGENGCHPLLLHVTAISFFCCLILIISDVSLARCRTSELVTLFDHLMFIILQIQRR